MADLTRNLPHRILWTLIITALSGALPLAGQSQWLKTIPEITENTPAWAQLMYAPEPNIRLVDSAYQAYYRTHAFEKNTHTQNYKHWRPKVEPYVQQDGSLNWPTAQERRQTETAYQRALSGQEAQRQTGTWTNIGPFETFTQGQGQFEVSWQVNVYTLDQSDTSPSVLYCGTESGGVFRSDNSGQTWMHVSANTMMNNVRIVRIDPNNASVVYAGDWERLYRTTDGGESWEILLDAADLPQAALGVNAIAVSPADGQRILVGGVDGLWLTEDGGANWSHLTGASVYDIEFKPDEPQVLYLVRNHGTEPRCIFEKSEDGGQSWTVKAEGWYDPDLSSPFLNDGGAKIAVSPLDPDLVVAGLIGNSKAGDDGYLGVWKSTDNGESWNLQGPHVGGPYEYSGGSANHKNIMINEGGGGPYQGFYDYVLAISPFDEDIVYTGGVSLYKSTDGGAVFNVIGGYQGNTWIHPDMQEITVGPDGIWLGTDGGIDFTDDEFATVESRKYGITGSEFWGFGSAWNEDLVVGGRYHNGNTAIRPEFEQGQSLRLGGAEAPTGYVQPGGRNIAYFSDISSQIVPQSLSGAVLQAPKLELYPTESYFSTHSSEIEFLPHCYNHFYLGRENKIWKTTDGGRSYTLIAEFGNEDQPVMQLEVCRSNPNVVYVYQRTTFTGAHLLRTEDGGLNWTTLDFPGSPVSKRAGGLALNPENENDIWAYFAHNANDGAKVFHSVDGGQTWENATTPLLDGHRIHTMLFQAGTVGTVYIGTDRAVFYRDETMEDWAFYNEGLPMRTNTNIFRPFYRDGKLRVGTYSNGAWEAPLVTPSRLMVQPTVDKLEAGCSRDTFYFDDYSVLRHEGASWSWAFEPAPAYISDPQSRNPKVVFGAPGTYTAVLSITDGTGESGMRALPPITVEACRADSLPGLCMETQEWGDYAIIDALPATAPELTLTAWIHPYGTQAEYTGIAITESGPAAGLNFRPDMELGYHWPGGAWWWSSGLFVPADEWSHVALVVKPDGITVYLNGEPASHTFSPEAVDLRNTALFLGSYRGWVQRGFKGLMDEVRVYDRALSIEEVRLNRHLTARPETEQGLVGYYQFNEAEGSILNKAGVNHAFLTGAAARTLSQAPVGGGQSARQTVQNAGSYTFGETGINLSLNTDLVTESVVVATRLNVPPSLVAGPMVQPDTGYWILNTYGNLPNAEPVATLKLSGFELHPNAPGQPEAFELARRDANAGDAQWMAAGTALEILPDSEEAAFAWEDALSGMKGAQLQILQGDLTSAVGLPTGQAVLVYPNPVRSGQPLEVVAQMELPAEFSVYNAQGQLVYQQTLGRQQVAITPNLASGTYTYRLAGAKKMCTGKLVIIR
ncbi:LamG-like jellyroll fold domain-containing protein [Phaeodactylibacter sp.]|uniref:LamG-like jellyroll fold domain-containing protein n=1 Tax=Phaeodactylibacter sp. TaxID=1940289 RepID=UPI0025F53EB4|nr:LamG-like jellyroll fold domain-containing protein [Phaeodactylibacter sp.]MCI4646805.1 T9SS type A sorting domain-containing protein [Phaeodactylibacter sp.]MCI5090301.1 T9SS type A sorting domain-containing protein [Phaeodactylibacter sp.]